MTYTTDRRRFLMQLGAGAAAGASAPLLFDVLSPSGAQFAWGVGEGESLPSGTPIIVQIAMEGGNDYLNTLVPVGDGWYNDVTYGHGSLALGAADTLPLVGTTYRLHKSLQWLADRWNNRGDVAFALGVGNGKVEFSHFSSQRFWEYADTSALPHTGWLGRYADLARPGNPLASVSIGDYRGDAIGKTAPTLVLRDASQFKVINSWYDPAGFQNSAHQMATIPGDSVLAEVSKMYGTTFGISDRILGAADPAITGNGTQGYSWITQQLLQAAILIRAGLPSQNYTMGFGPFDTHIQQKAQQVTLFNQLNEGLTKFFGALAGHPRERDVFVLITSEFGRQATMNQDAGTDHGQAGMSMFIGGGVQRGVYGLAPTLDPGGPTRPYRLMDALRPTVDFRTVHATALNRLAKGDTNVSDGVLGAHYEDLGVFKIVTTPATTTTAAAITTTTAAAITTTTAAVTTTTMKPTTTTTAKPTTTTTVKPTTTTTAKPANQPPVAVISVNKSSGKSPLIISANANSSRDPDGTIKTYRWEWGDGTAASSSKSVTKIYIKKGTFAMKLTVTDDLGATGVETKLITVS